MLGRDAHIINNLSNHVLPSYMLILVFHCLPRYQERECICETMNPGPFLIIRNTFPTLLSPLLFAAIFNSENIKTLSHLAFIIKNQKYHLPLFSPSLHIYFTIIAYLLLFAYLFYYHSHTLCLTTTWWGWGHKTIYVVAGSQEKDKEITPEILVPREFDIKPSSHPSWGKLSSTILYTLHLESQPKSRYLCRHQDLLFGIISMSSGVWVFCLTQPPSMFLGFLFDLAPEHVEWGLGFLFDPAPEYVEWGLGFLVDPAPEYVEWAVSLCVYWFLS